MAFQPPLIPPRIYLRLLEKSAKRLQKLGMLYSNPHSWTGCSNGYPRSKVPCFTLAGGVTGFFTGMLIVWFMNSFDYPLIVGGKPYFSPIFPFQFFTN